MAMNTVAAGVRPANPTITKARYTVVRAFDYLTAGRSYDVETRSNSKMVDVRRTDGSGIGTCIQMWQFKRALADGFLLAREG